METGNYYSFVSFLRKGLSNGIEAIPDLSAGAAVPTTERARAKITATTYVKFDDQLLQESQISKNIELFGPGNIVGIDHRAIIRTEPQHYCTNFEPNYLASIDFLEEDFPWRFSPTVINADATENLLLTPWLALVVLTSDEFDAINIKSNSNEKTLLSSFKLKDNADANKIFPKIGDLHKWAHVHVNTDLSGGDTQTKLKSKMDDDGDNCYSRIICPRKLAPNKSYHAFLIPSFETGRLAGLGNYQEIENTFVNTAAWGNREVQTEFPYYHRWYFATGNMGDFEYLVNQLKCKAADTRIGFREVSVNGIEDPLQFPGAMRVPLGTMDADKKAIIEGYEKWAGNVPHDWQKNIEAKISNQIKDQEDPVVKMPIYGRWHANVEDRLYLENDGKTVLNDKSKVREWIPELNLDPRYRAIAAFGASVIQAHQEELMDAAWQQVEGIREANENIRLAQLAIQTNKAFQKAILNKFTDEQLIAFTASLHANVRFDAGISPTVYSAINKSSIPNSVSSNLFRKVTRNTNRIAKIRNNKNQFFSSKVNLLDSLNKNNIQALRERITPVGFNSKSNFNDLVINTLTGKPSFTSLPTIEKNQIMERVQGALSNDKIFIDYLSLPSTDFKFKQMGYDLPLPKFVATPPTVGNAYATATNLRTVSLATHLTETIGTLSDGVKVGIVLPLNTVKPTSPVQIGAGWYPIDGDMKKPPVTGTVTGTDLPSKDVIIMALENTQLIFSFLDEVKPKEIIPINIAHIKDAIRLRIEPLNILQKRFNILFPTFTTFYIQAEEWFAPVTNYPIFDLPMYMPLKEKSTEYFLPNIELIEPNSITLLETNQKFIEAYMAGLNHEMARELLWRGYPTDQRGSYFRLFWDSIAARKDITEMHTWNKHLGFNNADKTDILLVLVVRGDLLKKYPNTVIAAQKAAWDGSIHKERKIDETASIVMPIFEAFVGPDIYFIGFNLKEEDLIGKIPATSIADDAGWFFTLKERPGEPRFGLDLNVTNTKTKWSDVSWQDVGTDNGDIMEFDQAINFQATADDQQAKWPPTNSAQLAYILYQQPVLVAVHASRLLNKK